MSSILFIFTLDTCIFRFVAICPFHMSLRCTDVSTFQTWFLCSTDFEMNRLCLSRTHNDNLCLGRTGRRPSTMAYRKTCSRFSLTREITWLSWDESHQKRELTGQLK